MKKCIIAACAALFVLTTEVSAQVITNGEIERGLRFPQSNYEYEPFTQRYSYGIGQGILYFNGDARTLWYLDYLDRADRAKKFGYPMPRDPYFDVPPEPTPVVERPRFGFGILRRR